MMMTTVSVHSVEKLTAKITDFPELPQFSTLELAVVDSAGQQTRILMYTQYGDARGLLAALAVDATDTVIAEIGGAA